MADKIVSVAHGDIESFDAGAIGKAVLVYNTYANALAFGATGLLDNARLFEINKIDQTKGDAITQSIGRVAVDGGSVTPDVGVPVDNNGRLEFVVDDNAGAVTEVFIVSDSGYGRTPRKITL